MKPKNFPLRKLKRRMRAQGKDIDTKENAELFYIARNIRTKKNREKKDK